MSTLPAANQRHDFKPIAARKHVFMVPLPRHKLKIDLNRHGLASQAQLLQ